MSDNFDKPLHITWPMIGKAWPVLIPFLLSLAVFNIEATVLSQSDVIQIYRQTFSLFSHTSIGAVYSQKNNANYLYYCVYVLSVPPIALITVLAFIVWTYKAPRYRYPRKLVARLCFIALGFTVVCAGTMLVLPEPYYSALFFPPNRWGTVYYSFLSLTVSLAWVVPSVLAFRAVLSLKPNAKWDPKQ